MSLEAGTKLGHYDIVDRIGAGGMGEVYRARDTRLDREVAIKVLPDEFAQDPARLERFEREAKAIAGLSHPNILAIHDFGRHDGVVYAAMELLEGATLREILANGSLPPRKATEYAVQTADGLAAAHDKGVVHRDLKPENLFVTKEGRVKILDFGLAKIIDTETDQPGTVTPTATAHTGPGVTLGTVGYMSPEQVQGREADVRADIFSLGVVLYEMLAGRRAFAGDSAVETMSAILKEDPAELSSLVEGLPPGLVPVVRHCLEKNAEERFQSARDLRFSLESTLDPSASGVVPQGIALDDLPGRRRRLSPVWAIGLLLMGALVGIIGDRWATDPVLQTQPTLQNLTYRRGAVWSGRFAPDGQTVIYGAAWDGQPLGLFATSTSSRGSTPLPFGWADLLAISSRGELAISLNRRFNVGWESSGTLARVPLAGGAPREVAENVLDADWSPDGQELAVVRVVDDRYRLEYPIGNLLYEPEGWISRMRISPGGDRLAIVEHSIRGDNVGRVAVVDLEGNVTVLMNGGGQGIAWSTDGDEVWVGNGGTLNAVSLDGNVRQLYRAPLATYLLDVDADGNALIAATSIRREMVGLAPGTEEDRNLTWLDWSTPRALSADGRSVFFGEGNTRGDEGYWLYLRGTDGSTPVRLGEGLGLALSPDGKWALALRRPFGDRQPVLLPTGAGDSRELDVGGLRFQPWAAWVPGRDAVLFAASEGEGPMRIFIKELDGGDARPITPEGIRFTYDGATVSPDGRWLVAAAGRGQPTIFPIEEDGEPRPLPGAEPGEIPVQWGDDGEIYVYRPGDMPTPVHRIDVETGRRTLWREIAPPDGAGVFNVDKFAVTRDGSAYTYSYKRMISRLAVVQGLH